MGCAVSGHAIEKKKVAFRRVRPENRCSFIRLASLGLLAMAAGSILSRLLPILPWKAFVALNYQHLVFSNDRERSFREGKDSCCHGGAEIHATGPSKSAV